MATPMIEARQPALAADELAGARVLVVDDSPSVLAFASQALDEAGCVVKTSSDIWIASAIGDFRPDLVLIDVHLAGGCSGPAVISALKRRSIGSGVRFVLYSSEPEAQLRRLAAECGADDALHKDGDRERLVGTVARLLGAGA